MHMHISMQNLGGSGGILPQDVFRMKCSEIASEVILGQRHSHSSYMACGVLHPIFGCPCIHLLSQLILNFHERRYKVDRTAGGMTDSEIVCREY